MAVSSTSTPTSAELSKQVVDVGHGDGEVEDFSDISLRLLDLSDVDDLMVWFADDQVSRFCSWEASTSREASMNYIVDSVIPHPWFRAICLRGRAIGTISVTPNNGNDCCRAEIGYLLASKYWGKGIATRTVKLVASAILFEWPYLERLQAVADVNNPGSQRVSEKAGFKREGVLRKYYLCKGRPVDAVIFTLLSTDPVPT